MKQQIKQQTKRQTKRQINATSLLLGLVMISTLLLLGGCSEDDPKQDLHTWMRQQRAQTRARVTPLPQPKSFVPQAYIWQQEIEPFDRLKLVQLLRSERPAPQRSNQDLLSAEQDRRKEELENFPIDAIAMVGTLEQGQRKHALLRVNGLIYQVGIGSYMGQNYGRVEEISLTSIQIREVVQDPSSGDWIKKQTLLELTKP